MLDTNIVVSGLLWTNAPSKPIDAGLEGRIEIFTTQVLMLELADVLPRPKFSKRVAASGLTIQQLIARYAVLAQSVESTVVPAVSPDPDDDHILACALAAEVDLIVSGDIHLLGLKPFQRIPIVSPADALVRVEQQRGD